MGSTRPRFPVCSQEARARRKRRKEPVVGGRAACSGKKELALHCQRRTRGAETTENLLNSLFATIAPATDMLGVPCSGKRCWARYGQSRKKNVGCIQDPPEYNCTSALAAAQRAANPSWCTGVPVGPPRWRAFTSFGKIHTRQVCRLLKTL